MASGPMIPVFRYQAGEGEEIEPLFDPTQFLALSKSISHIIDDLWDQDDKESLLVSEKARLMIDEDPEAYDEAFARYCEDCLTAAELSGNDAWRVQLSDFQEDARRLMARLFLVEAQIDNKSARFLHKLFRMISTSIQDLEKQLNDEGASSSFVKIIGKLNPLRAFGRKKPSYAPVNMGICFVARERIARILELCVHARDHGLAYRFAKPDGVTPLPGGEVKGTKKSVRFLD